MKKHVIGILMFALAGPAFAGPREVGNGGDSIANDFRRIGKELVYRLRSSYPVGMRPVDLDALEKKVLGADIEPTDEELVVDGIKKTAKNYRGRNLIQVNRARWISDADPRRTVALVLHEFHGLIDDQDLKGAISDYFLSQPALSLMIAMSASDHSPGPWICYLQVIEELAAVAGGLIPGQDPVEHYAKILQRYFVSGYEPLPGMNFKYQVALVRYRTFRNDFGSSFTQLMFSMARAEFSRRDGQGAVAELLRRYSGGGLPPECSAVLKVDPRTRLIVGAVQ